MHLSESQEKEIEALIAGMEEEQDDDAESIIANERYNYITSIIEDCYLKRGKRHGTITERIDNIVTHRFFALPIFGQIGRAHV